MKNMQFILMITLFLLLSTSVYAAVVSHPASEITIKIPKTPIHSQIHVISGA